MNNEDFKVVVDGCIENIKQVLESKSQEYSSKEDKLHNFVAAAKLMRCKSKEYALLGMLNKHLVSVIDMIVKYEQEGILPSAKLVNEKIGDSINYFVLLKACFMEDISIKENGWTVGNIKSIRERIGKMDKLGEVAKFICGDCANQKTCNEIGIIRKDDEATSCVAFKSKWEKKEEDDKIKDYSERAMSLTEIFKQNEGAIANSMYQNPRKRLVVENLRKILKPLFIWLTDNNRFVDYEKIKGILNTAELERDHVPDEFIKDVVVEIEKLDDILIEMRDKGNKIIADILRPPLTKFKVGDEIVTISCPAWDEKWSVSGNMNIATIRVGIEDKEIYYHGLFICDFVKEKDCFATKEEAEKECERRNKEIEKGSAKE